MSRRFRSFSTDENTRIVEAQQEQEAREAKLNAHKYHLFGRDNIMFDCTIMHTNLGISFKNTNKYQYTMTCKLCQHVTKRISKINLYLCAGCNREWDPTTNTILKPTNHMRISRARVNGKLTLPCDEESVPKDTPKVGEKEVTMKIVELSPGQHFYCQVTGTLYIVKI